MTSLSTDADISAGTDLLGKTVDDLQSDIFVGPEQITGTLKYVTGYTGFSGDPAEQSGHYLVLHSEATDGAAITVQVLGGDHGPVTLDEDGICILRIKNTSQKVKITASKQGLETAVKIYDLTALVLEEA